MCPRAHEFVMSLADKWSMDTRAIEGENNVIKVMVRRSNNIQWKLLKARLFVKQNVSGLCNKVRDPQSRDAFIKNRLRFP